MTTSTAPSAAPKNVVGQERWFFLFLTLVYAFMYVWAISSSAELRSPGRFVIFTVLINLHIALHWFSSKFIKKNRVGPYLVVQGILAFVLVLLANSIGPLMGLYLGLIGAAVGMLRPNQRLTLTVVGAYLGLSAINYIFISGYQAMFWWALAVLPMTAFVVIYVTLYSRQAEAREQAQELLLELQASHRQLAEYATRVEELTRSTERQRMARELHDTLAQGLAGLILQLEAADSHLGSQNPARAQTIIQQAMARARTTLSESRRVIDDLRASTTGREDLAEALGAEVEHFKSATGLPCALALALPPALPPSLTEPILRTVAEGLTNVLRYAQAHQAWVRLTHTATQLEIEVRDDGRGFNPDDLPAGHYGLLGLQERARLAGGTLTIASQPGQGTSLKLVLPLAKDN